MMISIQNLVKRYGDLLALDHFNLEVREGEIFGLLGPNGSGKTTAINCLLSLLKYDKGEIRLFDKPMSPDAYDIKRNIGVIFQNVAVFNEMNVRENIDYFCGLYVTDKARRTELVDQAIDFVGLRDFQKMRPQKLSGGLLRRLNIACGIAHQPKLIIMDEPTVAVDPQSRNNILEGIERLNREGATVLYTSHYMEEVEQICTRISIMDQGKMLAQGTADELKGMIRAGEKITAEVFAFEESDLERVRSLPFVASAQLAQGKLCVQCARGQDNLIELLGDLQAHGTSCGRVYSEMPTLNDVFLEITGKELRD